MSCIDTLRLSSNEQQELLRGLERDEADRGFANLRHHQRLSYQPAAGIVISLGHPGGSQALYLVRPRNISAGGIGFLHGNYLHEGSHCGLALRTIDKRTRTLAGRVAWCRHLRGRVHEVGVSFKQSIDIQQFVSDCLRTEDDSDATSTLMPQLSGRVLHVEDAVEDQNLLRFQLGQLGVELDTAPNAVEAMQQVQQTRYDLILAGIWLPGMSGTELAAMLRERGCKSPVIALTADPTPAVHQEARDRGCEQVVVKPFTFERLVEVLRPYLGEADSDPGAPRELVSQYWSNAPMRPLIRQFVRNLPDQLAECDAIVDKLDGEAPDPLLRKRCLALKGSAGGYGFPAVSEAARRLHELIEAEADADQLRDQYAHLKRLVEAAVAGLDKADTTADSNR